MTLDLVNPTVDNDHITRFLLSFPPDQFFRYFVDAAKQENGWKSFENNEPGYLKGVYAAFFNEMAHIDEPLSIEVILRIHDHSVNGVRETNYEKNAEVDASQFRNGDNLVGFRLNLGKNLSPAGKEELERQANGEFPVFEVIEDEYADKQNKTRKTYKLRTRENNLIYNVENIIAKYNEKISKTMLKTKKIEAIVEMVSKLERLHPFLDANCRTLCMTLLYRELLKHKLYPPLLDDPNQFDGFSMGELMEKVIDGSLRTTEMMDNKTLTKPLTPFNIGVLEDTTKTDGKDRYSMPETTYDLTNKALKMLDYPKPEMKEEEIQEEKAIFERDQWVHQVIWIESLEVHYPQFAQRPELSEFRQNFEKNKEKFLSEFIAGDPIAVERFMEMIRFGCAKTVNELLKEVSKNVNQISDPNQKSILMTHLLQANVLANKIDRKEMLPALDAVVEQLVLEMIVKHPTSIEPAIQTELTKNSVVMEENAHEILDLLFQKMTECSEENKLEGSLNAIYEVYQKLQAQRKELSQLEGSQAFENEPSNDLRRGASVMMRSVTKVMPLKRKCSETEKVYKTAVKAYLEQDKNVLKQTLSKR